MCSLQNLATTKRNLPNAQVECLAKNPALRKSTEKMDYGKKIEKRAHDFHSFVWEIETRSNDVFGIINDAKTDDDTNTENGKVGFLVWQCVVCVFCIYKVKNAISNQCDPIEMLYSCLPPVSIGQNYCTKILIQKHKTEWTNKKSKNVLNSFWA